MDAEIKSLSFLGEQSTQLIVAVVSELKCDPLSHGEDTPRDCVASHCQDFGLGHFKVIVQLPRSAQGSNSCSVWLLQCHCHLGG